MKPPRVEIERVNIRLQGGQWTAREAERAARLIVRGIRDEIARRKPEKALGSAPGGGRNVAQLAPDPVRIARGSTVEETARKAALEICRKLGEKALGEN